MIWILYGSVTSTDVLTASKLQTDVRYDLQLSWVSMLEIYVTVFLPPANGVTKVMFSVVSVRQSFCPPPCNFPRPRTCSNLFNLDLTAQGIWLKCLLVYLPSATKLQRLCFYRHLSVHRGVPGPRGECLVPGGVCSYGGVCSQGRLSQHTLRQTPPPGETASAADSTHPTGMHSCFVSEWPIYIK